MTNSETSPLDEGGQAVPASNDLSERAPVRSKTFAPQYPKDFAPLLSCSPKMRAIQQVIEDIADTNATVLIGGESGVGKDLVARAIHAASARRDGPFVKVNCAALPAELLESELFGHEKGAFTGAYRRKLGQFEYANGGTIYLDEIGELPLGLQAKLLHVLQDFRFGRIGGRDLIYVDARVIASTNRDLEVALRRREFREDLYYRLNVVEIHVPPLRERLEEIPPLIALFLARFNEQYQRNKVLSPETTALLLGQRWSGNVRELENIVRRLVVLVNDVPVHETLRACLRRGISDAVSEPSSPFGSEGLKDIARRGAQAAERKALVEVLEHVQWNRAEAARLLKVSYKTLLNKISESRLSPPPRPL
jgi:transcriptional regulator with GAF, ATPase, and Fis domain